METGTPARILTEAAIESLRDRWDARRGLIPADQVRRVIVADALVDMEVKSLSLPTRLIRRLGLNEQHRKLVRSGTGVTEAAVYDPVRLTIPGRDFTADVIEVPDDMPVLIGRLALLQMDLVIDPQSRSLIGNPAHDGEQILEV